MCRQLLTSTKDTRSVYSLKDSASVGLWSESWLDAIAFALGLVCTCVERTVSKSADFYLVYCTRRYRHQVVPQEEEETHQWEDCVRL